MHSRTEPVKLFLRTAARWIAELELPIVLVGVAPVLLFDAWMPKWAICAALVTIPTLWLIRWVGYGSPIRATPLDLPILLLLTMVPVGVWASAIKSSSLPEIYRVILGVGLFYSTVGTLNSARRLRSFAGLLILAVPVLALLALLGTQWSDSKFQALAALYDWLPAAISPFWRPTGMGPNSVAGGLAMLLPITIGFALGARPLWLRANCALASLFAGSILVLTQSRGALLGLAFAVLVILVLWNRWFLLAIPAAVVSVVALVWSLGLEWFSGLMLSSTATSAVASFEGRLEIWTRALYMIQDFPITGVGLGMFDHALDLLYPMQMAALETKIYHPHNVLLFQAVSSGLPGLVTLLALFLLLAVMAVQSARRAQRGRMWPLAIGLAGALAAYWAHGLFDSPTSFIKASAILWTLFGVQAALWLHLREHGPPTLQQSDGAHG
jgi:hypothetical protein